MKIANNPHVRQLQSCGLRLAWTVSSGNKLMLTDNETCSMKASDDYPIG